MVFLRLSGFHPLSSSQDRKVNWFSRGSPSHRRAKQIAVNRFLCKALDHSKASNRSNGDSLALLPSLQPCQHPVSNNRPNRVKAEKHQVQRKIRRALCPSCLVELARSATQSHLNHQLPIRRHSQRRRRAPPPSSLARLSERSSRSTLKYSSSRQAKDNICISQ